ncbi:WH2 motif family protein [Aphelenchoides avenae]|nr:WH2 motif family protein [Aphelenchus avenae]
MGPVSLEGNHMRKAFKSTNLLDQHSVDRQTLPNPLSDTYVKCDQSPQLDLLNPYREDRKSALRYYTDPSYFFDLWKQEMLKETRRTAVHAPLARLPMLTRLAGARRGSAASDKQQPLRQKHTLRFLHGYWCRLRYSVGTAISEAWRQSLFHYLHWE